MQIVSAHACLSLPFVVRKSTDRLPAAIPAAISNVFENSEFAVFKVYSQRMGETVPQTPEFQTAR
jgi:hypothetical protein